MDNLGAVDRFLRLDPVVRRGAALGDLGPAAELNAQRHGARERERLLAAAQFARNQIAKPRQARAAVGIGVEMSAV